MSKWLDAWENGFEWLDARNPRCDKWLEWKEENCECGISGITGKWSEELAERVGCECEELYFDTYLELVGDAAFPIKYAFWLDGNLEEKANE